MVAWLGKFVLKESKICDSSFLTDVQTSSGTICLCLYKREDFFFV